MLGYDPDDDEVMLDWYNLVHPDDIARVQSRMRDHLEGKYPFFESVHRMKHQSGEWRWMKSRAKAVHRRQRPPVAPAGRRSRHHRTQTLRGCAVS